MMEKFFKITKWWVLLAFLSKSKIEIWIAMNEVTRNQSHARDFTGYGFSKEF